ncbi:MAG: tripartite tricarboxylate transporter permease [Candidatus Burarchaeum sp.]|nr:tripartite tricarboxylate transporter permease [Candidatus Burarchaeum sp.]MDO8340274.1 tripartite tricarboxylate transporter permease [Candidatus Burarchaeum sp.]
MFALLFAVLVGILLGFIAGLVPGLHPNTFATVLSGLGFDPLLVQFCIIALAAAATVFESLRAIFLFIPDSNTVLTILPGHRMLMEGKGMRAVAVCSLAFIASTALAFLLLPVSLALFPALYAVIAPITPQILLALSIALLATERKPGKIAAATLCFLLAGFLGILLFTQPIVPDPLFPAFAGLFAISGLVMGMSQQKPLPPQRAAGSAPLSLLPVIAIGTLLAALADLLPGLSSPAQIAVFASIFTYMNSERFLALTSSIASSHLIFALAALLTTGKARMGAVAIVGEAASSISPEWIFALAGAALLATGIAAYLLMPLARFAVPFLSSVKQNELNALVLAYLLSLIFLIGGGPAGLLIAMVAAFIGALPPILGVRRTHVMGFILLPSIARLFI